MISAWGSLWGGSWGASWGLIDEEEEKVITGGGRLTPRPKVRPFHPSMPLIDIDTPRRRLEEEILLACIL